MNIVKKIIDNPYLLLIARIIVGVIFIAAAIPKIADPAAFASEIARYGIIPSSMLNTMALTLPWMELIASLFLISGIRLRANSLIIGAMLVVFILAIASAMIQGLNINCGCHTKGLSHIVGWRKIFEDVGLLAFCSMIFFSSQQRLTLDGLAKSSE
jgi:uncharacterized membrane protein YphA (DoxX/SURF4 family)